MNAQGLIEPVEWQQKLQFEWYRGCMYTRLKDKKSLGWVFRFDSKEACRVNQAGQQIQEIALRIREMRNIMGYSTEEMAIRTQVDEKTYVEYETGNIDLPFSFITILNNTEKIPLNLSPIFVACFSFCFALSLGAIWEIYEFTADSILQKVFF